ncbi:MAG TPA: arsenic resistance N-acetyltransferase ArsN2 [Steroidobacteraceae bacterium]
MAAPSFRIAIATDTDAIRSLLDQSGLPTADLAHSVPEFIVACEGAIVVGTGGLQRCGATGLLRSVVVSESWRGSGVGRAIVERLERRAQQLGLSELVLLTQTATRFFERQGYRVIERRDAPAAVLASEEFRMLCPQSAVCMLKYLHNP